jgi:hypothetical protein|tara:strand:+ start:2715 stop:2954 length:240 start_codon:yes stop_codon:yes gene_type:complete
MRWAEATIEKRGLQGIRLRSARLWLDDKGFHPFLDQDELIRPDMQKSMCCKYEDYPKEAWDVMDIHDMNLAKGSIYARA